MRFLNKPFDFQIIIILLMKEVKRKIHRKTISRMKNKLLYEIVILSCQKRTWTFFDNLVEENES